MSDHEYGVESCVFTEFKEETNQLESMIDHYRKLLRRTGKLIKLNAKQLREETGKLAPATKRPSRKRK